MTIKFFMCPTEADARRVLQTHQPQAVAFTESEEGETFVLSNFELTADWRFTQHRLCSAGVEPPHPVLKLQLFRSSISVPVSQFRELVEQLGYSIREVTVPEKVPIKY